jgi:hypothetical protein
VALVVPFDVFRSDFFDTAVIHPSSRNEPVTDQLPQPFCGGAIELVVIHPRHGVLVEEGGETGPEHVVEHTIDFTFQPL